MYLRSQGGNIGKRLPLKKTMILNGLFQLKATEATSATRDDPISLLSLPGPETISKEMGN